MQAWPDTSNRGSTNRRFSKMTTYTLLCFALAGLLAGFAFGGFAGHKPGGSTGGSTTSKTNTPAITQQTPISSATQGPEDVPLGEPAIAQGDYTYQEMADGTTSYTLAAQVVNKNTNTPIQATDVTCRLWLTKDPNATAAALSANGYAIPKAVDALNQPFPNEEQGALTFTAPSQQVQPCAANGKTTWTYTVSPTVHHDTYYLAVLADWKGKHYNWYMVATNIKANNGGN